IEGEIYEAGAAAIGGLLHKREGGHAVRANAAELAVEIGGLDIKLCERGGGCGILDGPVESGAGEKLDGAVVDSGGDSVAVELDLMDPQGSARGFCRELAKLWLDPFWRRHSGNIARGAREWRRSESRSLRDRRVVRPHSRRRLISSMTTLPWQRFGQHQHMQTRRSPFRTRSARASVAALIGPSHLRSASYLARKRSMTALRAAASLGLWRTNGLPRTRFLRSMSTAISPGPGLPGAPARLLPRRMEPGAGAFMGSAPRIRLGGWPRHTACQAAGRGVRGGQGRRGKHRQGRRAGGADFVERT